VCHSSDNGRIRRGRWDMDGEPLSRWSKLSKEVVNGRSAVDAES
jgi:hypothetical protein